MKKIIIICLVGILLSTAFGAAAVANTGQPNDFGKSAYQGRIRIYVTEPVSRWNMYNGQPYHYGFLGFALNQVIFVNPQETYHNTIVWNGDVSESNVEVMAAVFNSEPHQGYAKPPSEYPFTAYYTDASAVATPGNTGYNTVNEDFSHTIFVEEATATWCPYCPAMANTLYAIHQSGDYPWNFVALVADKNSQAAARLAEYNTYGYPTAFFDGGYQVYVGGSTSQSVYRSRIENCGKREVPDLNLTLSVTYIGNGDLEIEVTVKNNAPPNQPPLTPEPPAGPSEGEVNLVYTYTAVSTDPDGDHIYYEFDWDDGLKTEIGPYNSGEIGETFHHWTEEGVYNVKVRARDSNGVYSDWSSSKVVVIEGVTSIDIKFKGGLMKVNAIIGNLGDDDLVGVDWSLYVKGGLLGLINSESSGTFVSIPSGGSRTVSTKTFGFGSIEIIATVNDVVFTSNGIVFGPLVII